MRINAFKRMSEQFFPPSLDENSNGSVTEFNLEVLQADDCSEFNKPKSEISQDVSDFLTAKEILELLDTSECSQDEDKHTHQQQDEEEEAIVPQSKFFTRDCIVNGILFFFNATFVNVGSTLRDTRRSTGLLLDI